MKRYDHRRPLPIWLSRKEREAVWRGLFYLMGNENWPTLHRTAERVFLRIQDITSGKLSIINKAMLGKNWKAKR